MSASEKLRALQKTGFTCEHWTDYDASDLAVTDELIAVVEAAEFARNWPEMPSDLRWGDFDDALAALDEALS